MAVKILIKRKFRPVDRKEISAMLIGARKNAMGMKGYISTETLVSDSDPLTFIMLSMWQSKADWESYKNSTVRQEHEQKMAEMLEGETQYEVCNMGM
jgi:heme-degrading monooxygenase HmoA